MGLFTAIAGGLSGLGAISNFFGSRDQQKDQNRLLQQAAQQFGSDNILQLLAQTNPQLAQALGMSQGDIQQGLAGFNPANGGQLPFDNPLANLAYAPGAINPQILNQAFVNSDRASQTSQQQLAGLIGRRGLAGGLADGFAFANQAASQQRNASIQNNFLNLTEQLRRQDIGQFQGILNQGLSGARQQAAGAAGILSQQQAPMNALQGLGQGISTGLSAFGAFQQFQPQQQQQQQNNIGGYTPAPGLGPGLLPNFTQFRRIGGT